MAQILEISWEIFIRKIICNIIIIYVFTENYNVLDSSKQSLAANVPNIILNRYYVSQLHRKPVLLGNPSKGKIICFFILIL